MSKTPHQQASQFANYPATMWDLLEEAQELPEDDRITVLGELLEPYRRPIHAYFRSKGISHQDAQDLVQDLICKFLANPEKINDVTRREGKFRTWLIKCAHNLMVDWIRKEGREQEFRKILEQDVHESVVGNSSVIEAWRRQILKIALETVEVLSRKFGRSIDYTVFLDYYVNSAGTWQDIAKLHRLRDWKDATRKADWIKAQFAKAIRAEIRKYAATEAEIDEEIRELLG